MRSILLAFVCIGAVACGSAIARFGTTTLLGPLLALVLVAARVAVRRQRAEHVLLVAVLACAGLVRGASVSSPSPARVLERGGSSATLRVFEVVGASEPGPRCTIVLRDAGLHARDAATITVSAPTEACPCWRGHRLALLSASLQPGWQSGIDDEELFGSGRPDFDLGEGAVLWKRPRALGGARRWFQRPLDGYWRWVAQRRQLGWEASRGDEAASMVVAVGLGMRSALAPEQRVHLRASGLGHLIAVSGLHVAIAAVWLTFVARRGAAMLGLSPAHACVIAWLPLWIYVGLTGSAASAIRAATMLTVVDLGTVVGRPTHGPTTLALVAAAMLLWQPQWLLDPGFALSIAAMAVIVSAPSELGLLATSWRISWVTAPLSVLYFDVAPLHSLLGNLVALPLFAFLMPISLVACVVPGPLGEWALLLGRLFATPILDVAQLLARVPGVGPLGLLLAGILGLLAWRRRPGPRLAIWLPPKLACVLAIVLSGALTIDAAAARPRDADTPSFDWIAMGTVHSRSLLVVDRSTPASACLYRPTGSTATWTWLLEQHAVSRVGRLDAALPDPERPQPPRSDPRTRALAIELGRAGVEIEDGPQECQTPTPEQVRAAVRSCRYLQGGRGPALARVWADELRCRIEDRWVRVEDGLDLASR
jgi:competence protein ComEC